MPLQDFRPDVDPSLCSKQRQLKRAKLADSLASQLSHRPGPLELIQKNILHTDDPVEQLVKQGSIAFTPTAEGWWWWVMGSVAQQWMRTRVMRRRHRWRQGI